MITVFTPSFADESNTNAQNLTVKEVVARMDASRYRVIMLGAERPDPRITARPNTEILSWGRRGNTARILLQLVRRSPDVYFFPREGPLDLGFLTLRAKFNLRSALVTYIVSGGLESGAPRPVLFRAIRESDGIAGNSRYMTETVRRLGGRDVQTVYDGIDRRYYYADGGGAGGPRRESVLFAGSFRPYKRVDLVVREAARHPEWEFRLAGIGEEEESCRKLVRDLHCDNVVFLGHLNAAQLGEEMRQAQLFFFPSEMEGHPQVLGQAAACGLPCIARSFYDPDYIVDGVTGTLAKSDEELSAALDHLMREREVREKMSAAAIQHAGKFNWDSITEQWQQIFERAAGERQYRRKRMAG